MAPDYKINMKEEDFKKLISISDILEINYNYAILPKEKNVTMIPSRESIKSKYLEIPSIGLAVPKERTLFGYNHKDSQDEIHSKGKRFPNMKEFPVILKFAKENDLEFYNEITQVRSPWRAERIDAKFDYEGDNWFMTYHVFDENGNIQEKREKLDKDTLMNDKSPGISIDSWIEDSTKQGLPKKSTKSGDLYYWSPDKDNNSVAWFVAYVGGSDLYCGRNPSGSGANLGVRESSLSKVIVRRN